MLDEKHRKRLNECFKPEFISKATYLALEENNFISDKRNISTDKGTATVTWFAQSYANLARRYLEEKLYEQLERVFKHDFKKYVIKELKRFFDDSFIVWDKSNEDLQIFNNILNTLHPSFKLITEYSINGLPVFGYLHKRKHLHSQQTYLTKKPTDTHQYLKFYSRYISYIK